MAKRRIHLDSAAGQAWPEAARAVLSAAAAAAWSLPQSVHHEAALARSVRDSAVADLAAAWGVPTGQVRPVHGLAAAIRLAVSGDWRASVVGATCRQGVRGIVDRGGLTVWPVDGGGRLRPSPVPDTELVCVQAGNPETGAIDDVAAARAAAPGARVVVDATEWFGRMPGLPEGDVLIARASSWGGPASVCFVIGAGLPQLAAKEAAMLEPDPVLLAAAATAWSAVGDVAARAAAHRSWLAELEASLAGVLGVRAHRPSGPALPHLLSLSVDGVDGEALAIELDRRGFAVGSGSACEFGSTKPSHVLAAMGEEAAASIRLGLPLHTERADLLAFAAELPGAVSALRLP